MWLHLQFSLLAVVLDVREFGATGDGVTDDYSAISAALANLSSSGGVLIFPAPGAYRRIPCVASERPRHHAPRRGYSEPSIVHRRILAAVALRDK
jgi:hypothetical protein